MGCACAPIAALAILLSLPVFCLGGQAVVALHRKNAQLDAVASRSAKNVAVCFRLNVAHCSLNIDGCLEMLLCFRPETVAICFVMSTEPHRLCESRRSTAHLQETLFSSLAYDFDLF